ncbi:MAG: hypothetical protein ACYDCJ_06215 [Gammaproteobacteria bacterium]
MLRKLMSGALAITGLLIAFGHSFSGRKVLDAGWLMSHLARLWTN